MTRKVLFLCTGNSCRSQMAEAIVNARLSEDWQAFSAGTVPAGYVHPKAIQVLDEIGITHERRIQIDLTSSVRWTSTWLSPSATMRLRIARSGWERENASTWASGTRPKLKGQTRNSWQFSGPCGMRLRRKSRNYYRVLRKYLNQVPE
jgi:hypothetical protein